MKFVSFFCSMMAVLLFTACDDTTEDIGSSLIDKNKVEFFSQVIPIKSRSFVAASVVSKNSIGYLGKIKDPETGVLVSGDFMTQFHTFENYEFPPADSILSRKDGKIIADSCVIRLFCPSYYGDSLATMKLTAYELERPVEEGTTYFTNFDPQAQGYVRENGLAVDKTFSVQDDAESPTVRHSKGYVNNIRIDLNMPYTDKQGVTYNNFGTYLMSKYYENPNNYKNSYTFIHNLVPGFYFKMKSGQGAMAYVQVSRLDVFFRYKDYTVAKKDSVYHGMASFAGTGEVLQTMNINYDKTQLEALAADSTCTYLKTPAGIFTELTLPVDQLDPSHDNDTISTAKLVLKRINNKTTTPYTLKMASTLLLIPKDSLQSFFANEEVVDNKLSYLSAYNALDNTYTFSNISGMLGEMRKAYLSGNPNGNKAVLVPVTISLDSNNNVIKVSHDMSMTNTKLVGGYQNPNEPITLQIIYSRLR